MSIQMDKQSLRQRKQSILSGLSDTSETLREFSFGSDDEEFGEKNKNFETVHLGWKRLLFLPFDGVWERILLIIAYINILIAANLLALNTDFYDKRIMYICMVIDGLFLIDNSVVVIGKLLPGYHVPTIYAIRPNWIIALEVLSILPFVHIDTLLNDAFHLTRYGHGLLILEYTKVFRIMFYFYYHERMVGYSKSTLLTFNFIFATTIVITAMFTCVTLTHLCFIMECAVTTVYAYLGAIVSAVTSNGFMRYPDETNLQITATVSAAVAFIGVIAVAISLKIAASVTANRHRYLFIFRMERIKATLIEMRTPFHLKNTVLDFYNLFWKTCKGYDDKKNPLNLLPEVMVLELSTDIHWYALMHSKIFHNTDLPFLRAVSLVMKQKFAMAGDVVYRKGETSSSMIYIVSGIVQVLSEEDQEAPLLSLSAGTCLGECNVVIPFRSSATVVCKELCEFHILELKNYVSVQRKFKKEAAKVKKIVYNRIQKARVLKKLTEMAFEHQGVVKDEQTTLSWIKSTLYRMMESEKSSSDDYQNVFLKEEFSQETFEQIHFYANNLDLLAIAKRHQLTTDTVFVNHSFPCIFKPDSIILKAWHVIVCFTTSVVCIVAPYYAFIEAKTPDWYFPMTNFVTVVFWIDFYVTTCTAVETTQELIVTIKRIFVYHYTHAYYWMDLVAAVPLDILYPLIFSHLHSQNKAGLVLNRVLKAWKLEYIMESYTSRGSEHIMLITYTKCALLYAYFGYFIGCTMHCINYFLGECSYEVLGDTAFQKMCWSLFKTINIVTTVGLEETYTFCQSYHYIYWILMYLSIVLYFAMQAKLTTTHVLQRYPRIQLQENVSDITASLNAYEVESTHCIRALAFITAHWRAYKGQDFILYEDIMVNLPDRTYTTIKQECFASYVKQIPLFADLSEDILFAICMTSNIEMYPPKEVISYSGQVQSSFYCIIEGSCQVISPLTKATEKMLFNGDTFYVLEACLNERAINTVITVTHCKILIFDIGKLIHVLNRHSIELISFREVIKTCELSKSLDSLYRRGSKNMSYDLGYQDIEEASYYSFGYRLHADSPEEYDYYVPFDRLQSLSFVRILLVRWTVMPFGKLIFFWETLRCFFAVLSSLFFVINPISTATSGKWWIVLAFLDLTAWLDIYFRCHVCYYDEIGILIKHPLKTALYYIKHGFFIDLLGAFPVHLFIKHKEMGVHNRLVTLFQCNRLLQLHRYVQYFNAHDIYYIDTNKFKFIIYYFVNLLLIANTLAAFISNVDCTFNTEIEPNGIFDKGVTCQLDSWYTSTNFSKPFSPIFVHVMSLYACSSILSAVGMQGFVTRTFTDAAFEACVSFFGIIFTMHVIAKVIALFSSANIGHLTFIDGLKCLKAFMSKNKIPDILQNEAVEHCKLAWQRKRGKDMCHLLQGFPESLQEDILYDVYGTTLEENCVFQDEARPFYRMLLLGIDHRVVGAGIYLAQVNDLKSKLHIVYKGKVDVIAPDGSKLTTLGVGAIYGNLDNYSTVRQTVGIVSKEYSEILTINSLKFYKLLKNFPFLYNSFKYLTAVHIDYLHGRKTPKGVTDDDNNERHIKEASVIKQITHHVFHPHTKGMFVWEAVQLFIVCYLTLIVEVWVYSVHYISLTVVVLQYTCDVLFLLDFLIKFRTAYVNKVGILVQDVHMIKKRVMNDRYTYILGMVSLVPLDIIILFVPKKVPHKFIIYIILRLNKWLRCIRVYAHRKESWDKINVNTIAINVFYLIYCVTIFLHLMSCLTINIGCLNNLNFMPPLRCDFVTSSSSLAAKLEVYLDTIYIVVLCFTRCLQSTFYPISYNMLILFSLLMLASIIFVALVLTEVFALAKITDYLQSLYEVKISQLSSYLEREDVSVTLVQRILSYLQLLWKKQHGAIYPFLLDYIPPTVRAHVLCQCFQHHISQNIIFKNCHRDFIRQVARQFHIITLFEGDYIVFKGTVNDSMYFVHEGEVLIISEDTTNKEQVLGKLIVGQYFGILQGLYKGNPYVYSFRSATDTILLRLEKKNWSRLLDFFPASKQNIYAAASEYSGF